MTLAAIEVHEVSKAFGGIQALHNVSFSVDRRQTCSIIGPNGAGKTTLFNCLSRIYPPTAGSLKLDGLDLLSIRPHQVVSAGVGRTFQNLALFPSLSVLDNVMVGAYHLGGVGFARAPFRFVRASSEERQLKKHCLEILYRLELAEFALHPADELPYGILKRIELARALASRPKVLMLDEPASGLNRSELGSLQELIRDIHRTLELTTLLVEHHMEMVMSISDKVIVLDHGEKLAEGSPESVSSNPDVIEVYLGSER